MDLVRITSPQNPYVKKVVAIRKDGLVRQQEGVFLVESERLVEEAIERGFIPRDLIYVPRMFESEPPVVERAARLGSRIVSVSRDVYKKIADTRNPVWLAALFPLPSHELIELLQEPRGTYLVASNVQDPGNLGTMWRSAACFGVSAFIVCTPACDLYNQKVLRAAAGAFSLVPAVKARPVDVATALERAGVPLYGAVVDAETDVSRLPQERPIAVAFGHETQGLHADLERALAGTFRIPQKTTLDSLNVAAACAITLYVLGSRDGTLQVP